MTIDYATKPILQAREITKQFGGLFALREVSIDVLPGEVHALMGANGAGKSTLIKAIAGIHPPDSGEMVFRDKTLNLSGPHEAIGVGIATMFQQLNVVEDLTVGEYLTLGRERSTLGFLRRRATTKDAGAALHAVGVDIDIARPASSLSVAERELVEIARAVSLEAQLLIMDEPTASLGDAEVARLMEVIRTLRHSGVAVLYVSHKLDEVTSIADRSTVLRDGRNAGALVGAEITTNNLLDLMVGSHDTITAEVRDITARPVLELRSVSTKAGLASINLSVHEGEVVGIYGLMGAGRTELLRAVYGLDHLTQGQIAVDGRPVRIGSPADAVSLGIGLVPEDRIREALIGDCSVAGNITLSAPKSVTRRGVYSVARERRIARRHVSSIGIKTSSVQAPISSLSGGNQQKVVIGRWLVAESRILLLDDPTVGVDVAAKEEIYRLVLEATKRGVSIVVCSSELSELMRLADRVVIMHQCRIVQSVARSDSNAEDLIRRSIVGLTDQGFTEES